MNFSRSYINILLLLILSFQINCKNYVYNPSFEILGGMVGADGWNADTYGGCYVVSSTAHTGSYSMHVPNPEVIFGKSGVIFSTVLNID